MIRGSRAAFGWDELTVDDKRDDCPTADAEVMDSEQRELILCRMLHVAGSRLLRPRVRSSTGPMGVRLLTLMSSGEPRIAVRARCVLPPQAAYFRPTVNSLM